MFRVSLSDSLLQNVFIPGAICLTGIVWLAVSFGSITFEPSMIEFLKARGIDLSRDELLATGLLAAVAVVTYLLAMFVGTVIAIFIGYFEWLVLDRWRATRLHLLRPAYEAQWYRYIDSLEKAHNSCVTKQVTGFHFEARSALALLVLCLCVLLSSGPKAIIWVSAVLAAFLFMAALHDHRELAEFRNRRFAQKPDSAAKPEDLLQELVTAWCNRRELSPLQHVLPILGSDVKAIADPTKTLEVLHGVVKLPDAQVSPSEKCVLSLIIAALTERTAPSGGL